MNEILNHITLKENSALLSKLGDVISTLTFDSDIHKKLLTAIYILIGTQIVIGGELLWLIVKH